ncbi:MAG TPA: hypothetical protein VIV10_02130 [Gemmatimonadales bacterium]
MAVARMGPVADARPDQVSQGRSGRWYYVGIAVAALAVTFAGFAHSFYLRPASMPALTPLVVVHGTVFSCWVLLFLTQTTLIATGHTRVHRRLGVAGAGLAVLIVVLGPMVAIPAARRGALPGDPLAFLLVMLGDLLLFAVFVAAGISQRHHSETHKRLMVLATVNLLPPAISRWPVAVGHPAVIGAVLLAFLAAAPVRDLLTRRRMHPVSLWGGLAVLLSVPVRFALSQTVAWHRVASWLIR